jgi:hypothetical protein
MLNFILGVVASICAAIVVAAFMRYTVPYIRGFLHNTPKIDGDWKVHIAGNAQDRGILSIEQQGVRIRATFKHLDGPRSFLYKGSFFSGQLVLTFEESGKEGFNVGAMLFRLHSDGVSMEGRTLFWHNDRSEFVSNQYEATRIR